LVSSASSASSWLPSADLHGVADLGYRSVVGEACPPVVPDGRTGIVWLSDGTVRVCGPETRPWRPDRVGVAATGLRLTPGVAHAVLGVPAWELRDRRVSLEELWGPATRRFVELLAASTDVMSTSRILETLVRSGLANGRSVDPVARLVLRRLTAAPTRVSALAGEAGMSVRQLQRHCLTAFGYPASTLARVLRLQRFLVMVRSPLRRCQSLSALAAAAGYADQAHLARDCHELTGHRPSALRGPTPRRRH
jgi:AraC-like DNA-binding protein